MTCTSPPLDAGPQFVRRAASPENNWLNGIATFVRNAFDHWNERRLHRIAAKQLHRLDDCMLRDMGISRAQIESAVRHGRPTRAANR
jgi:uncharacterized protein YjiS (DUF1127 family)